MFFPLARAPGIVLVEVDVVRVMQREHCSLVSSLHNLQSRLRRLRLFSCHGRIIHFPVFFCR